MIGTDRNAAVFLLLAIGLPRVEASFYKHRHVVFVHGPVVFTFSERILAAFPIPPITPEFELLGCVLLLVVLLLIMQFLIVTLLAEQLLDVLLLAKQLDFLFLAGQLDLLLLA